MARLPRVVIPGIPHHVTQRGNRRERTFFEEGDYALYLDLLADAARQARTEVVLLSHAEITVTVYKMHQIPGAQKILSYSR
jgi:REP element-mobilizing transposase RayT